MKKLLSLFSLLALILPIFSSIQIKAEDITNNTPKTKLGVILPLTGAFGKWGENIKHGYELANKKLNNKYELIYEDEAACDAKKALTAAQKHLNVTKVPVLFTGCLNGTKAIAPIINKNKTFTLSIGMLDEAIFKDSRYILSLAAQVGDEAIEAAKFLHNSGAKKIVLIRAQDNFTEELARVLKIELQKYNIQVLTDEASNLLNSDFRSILTKTKSLNPDFIHIFLSGEQTLALVRQKKDLQISTPIFGGYAIEGSTLEHKEKLELEGIKYTAPILGVDPKDPNKKSEQMQAFETEFKSVYGESEQPTVTAIYAYDGLLMLDKAFKTCGILKTTENPNNEAKDAFANCLRTNFTTIGKDFNGVAGRYLFNEDGSLTRENGIKIVKDGKFEWE